jgi:hypothetical protein
MRVPWKWLSEEKDDKRKRRDVLAAKKEVDRRVADETNTQRVVIVCEKWLTGVPGQFKSFQVRLSIPLSQQEIDERMQKAFPECVFLGDK